MAAPVRTPRSAWVDAGLHALATGGPEAVRIDPLARTLGVTRGGFYWHFADRGALLEELLDAWERRSVAAVIELVERDRPDGRARLRRLFALASARGELLRVDLAVRDWSRRDAAVAERLRRVDDERMAYLRVLFGSFCPDADEVEVRSLIVFALWIGSPFIAAGHGDRTRADVIALTLERLLR